MRRGFIKWLAGVSVAIAVDPLLGGQAIWGTDPARPVGLTMKQWMAMPVVFAPYIPLHTPVVFAEGALDAVRMKRYSETKLREDYYGTVTVVAKL
jgi:hypothetical protein